MKKTPVRDMNTAVLNVYKSSLISNYWQTTKGAVKKDCTSNWYTFIVDLEMTEMFKHLKGVFTKNERGYRRNAIKKRFWSPLILLLAVASIRRKLLKTTGFSNILKKYENVVFIFKNPRNRHKCFQK